MKLTNVAAAAGILLGVLGSSGAASATPTRATAAHVKPGAKPHKRHKTAKKSTAKPAATKDQAAKDQAAKDQAAKDQAAKDQSAKDQSAKDQKK